MSNNKKENELDDLEELEELELEVEEEDTSPQPLGVVEALEAEELDILEPDDEDDLELEPLDLDESELLLEGFEEEELFVDEGFLLHDDGLFDFIEEDVLGDEETALAALTSTPLALPDLGESEEVLLLDVDSDLDDLEDLGPLNSDSEIDLYKNLELPELDKFEVALSPKEQVLAVFKPQPNEVQVIEDASEELSNTMNNPRAYREAALTKLREFLDTPIFAILPKGVRFTSAEYKNNQDFRSVLIDCFVNRFDNNHTSIDSKFITKYILKIWKAENLHELKENEILSLHNSIEAFLSLGTSLFKTAQRSQELAQYKRDTSKKIECPELVTNMEYICKCGESYPMPNDYPTMTYYIVNINRVPQVTFMNTPVHCPKCNVWLALPSTLANELKHPMVDYVSTIKANYARPAVYRPKLEILNSFIPEEAKSLFSFNTESAKELKNNVPLRNQLLHSYKALTSMWMKQYVYTKELEENINKVKSDKGQDLLKVLSKANFSYDTKVRVYQMTKTIINYLELFSKFSITQENQVSYNWCEREGIENLPFGKEEAVKWIYDNAPYLASLNNTFDGDLSFEPLGIYPEYIPALNYVVGLYLLSDEKVIRTDSSTYTSLKNPESARVDLKEFYEKRDLKIPIEPFSSVREFNQKTKMFPVEAWGDSYTFFKTVASYHRNDGVISDETLDLIRKASRQPQEEFYGYKIDKRAMSRPYFYRDNFWEVFKLFGHELFTGIIVDLRKQNLAILLHGYNELGLLETQVMTNSKAINKIEDVTIQEEELEDENKLLFELIIRSAELPGEINVIRDEIGADVIISDFDQYRDYFTSDDEFMNKYGEVLSSY